MIPALREAVSRLASRYAGSRFAKPVARADGVAAGLLLLAFVGRTAAGAMGRTDPSSAPSSDIASFTPASSVALPIASGSAPAPAPSPTETSTSPPSSAPRSPASAEDPVALNTATVEDLRRLPGIGDKRANAILALRSHLGRFRAVDDLLKVKGIGRAMLKRLLPLVRLDPAAAPDAGSATLP